MEMLEIIDNLKKGKAIYVGYCLNADIDDKEMMFDSDKEAIAFYSNYEADVYKFYKENGELKKKLIYETMF